MDGSQLQTYRKYRLLVSQNENRSGEVGGWEGAKRGIMRWEKVNGIRVGKFGRLFVDDMIEGVLMIIKTGAQTPGVEQMVDVKGLARARHQRLVG